MKKSLGIIAIVILTIVGSWKYQQINKQNIKLSSLVLANIEALANGEDGTSVGVCFMKVGLNGKYGQKRFCNSNTNATTIYPFNGDSNDFYDENKKDRCTQ